MVNESEKQFDQNTYKLLAECSLMLFILFNRRKLRDYINDRKTNLIDFETAITEGEKIWTKK